MTSSFQILLRREWRTLDESAPSFQNSGRMLFHLTSFPFFRAFRDLLTSTMVLFPVRKTSDGPSRSCVFSGAGLFKSSWRCSFHWVSWPSVLVRSPPLLSLTGLLWTVLCPLSSFVMSKTFFMSLCFAATSACYMVSSIFLLLSSLQLLVTSCLFCCTSLFHSTFAFWSLQLLSFSWFLHTSLLIKFPGVFIHPCPTLSSSLSYLSTSSQVDVYISLILPHCYLTPSSPSSSSTNALQRALYLLASVLKYI